ncbi:hypothetical protein QYE76_001113 [Lolium multiflorum]|uniref:DUF4216 domain-containing protein n=1 Tax=Lolium multiflorum TaxID=4521 RepID=A0AAD8RKL8_LOLMU|nr:hypothetical protein QYE76_001113 [Lolium multiflorum]
MNVTDDEQLYLLAKQPSSTISTFQGYEINGNTFYTFAQDKKSTNQNSGVRFDAEDGNGNKVTYYGYIEEIWELDYGPNFKVPLFRGKWFNLKDGVQVDPQYGMTTVDFKNLGYDTEPFVLASEVAQKCAKQAQGTDLYGYYVCEYIHRIVSERVNNERNRELRRKREKISIEERFKAIGEELAGFFLREVIPPSGEFHYA